MRINFKQEDLIEELLHTVKNEFPEVELIDITESPEDSESLWINVTGPEDEDEDIRLRTFAGELTTDILTDYGYHILLLPTPKRALAEAQM